MVYTSDGKTNFGAEFSKILGLDPSKTATITLISEPMSVVKVHAELYVDSDEGHQIINLCKEFNVVFTPEDIEAACA